MAAIKNISHSDFKGTKPDLTDPNVAVFNENDYTAARILTNNHTVYSIDNFNEWKMKFLFHAAVAKFSELSTYMTNQEFKKFFKPNVE